MTATYAASYGRPAGGSVADSFLCNFVEETTFFDPGVSHMDGTSATEKGLVPVAPSASPGPLVLDRGTLVAEILDRLSNTISMAKSAGRPDLGKAGKKVSGTGVRVLWADHENIMGLAGTNAAGDFTTAMDGTCALTCTNQKAISSCHPGGADIALLDGSVCFLRQHIDINVAALITRADGEIIPYLD